MDEKEVVKDIRWKFSKGKSRAEITRELQKKGLKLEFIDSLVSRAKRPRKIIKGVTYSLILFIFMWMGVYATFFYHATDSIEYKPNWQFPENLENLQEAERTLEITPELISLVAHEIGAGKLRTRPLTLKKPIMNFQISDREFYTTIDKKIETKIGKSNGADLLFSTDIRTIEKIFSSDNIMENVQNFVFSGDIEIVQLASDKDLFLKGYLTLYNELKT